MVAQVDEQHAAMVAHAMHPARQADGFADIRLAQIGAGVAAVTMHFAALAALASAGTLLLVLFIDPLVWSASASSPASALPACSR
jgi:hypothetical protein